MPRRTVAPVGAPCWIDLLSSDIDRSRAFYGELFGWTSESAGPEYGGYVNFFRDGEPIAGAMGRQPGMEGPDGWSVFLAVEDAPKTYEVARAAGATPIVEVMPITDIGTMALVADPTGAVIGMWQPGTHPGYLTVGEPGSPSWCELFTRDFQASLGFYRDVFGWDIHITGDTDEFRYATLGEGDDALAGIMDASAWLPEGVPAHWSVYFEVADVDAALAKVVELGGSVVVAAESTPYGVLATAADPTGGIFKLRGS